MDMGNILLFEPQQKELKQHVKTGCRPFVGMDEAQRTMGSSL